MYEHTTKIDAGTLAVGCAGVVAGLITAGAVMMAFFREDHRQELDHRKVQRRERKLQDEIAWLEGELALALEREPQPQPQPQA